MRQGNVFFFQLTSTSTQTEPFVGHGGETVMAGSQLTSSSKNEDTFGALSWGMNMNEISLPVKHRG